MLPIIIIRRKIPEIPLVGHLFQVRSEIKLRIEPRLMVQEIRPAFVHSLPVPSESVILRFRHLLGILQIIAVKRAEGFIAEVISEFRPFFKSSFSMKR